MKPYTEYNLSQAIKAVENGTSIRRAALDWGIPRITLHDRLKGSQSHKDAAAGQQSLSKVQEGHLAQWILTQATLGLPPTHAELKVFAQRVLTVKGDSRLLGKRWVQAFLKKNPSIQV